MDRQEFLNTIGYLESLTEKERKQLIQEAMEKITVLSEKEKEQIIQVITKNIIGYMDELKEQSDQT